MKMKLIISRTLSLVGITSLAFFFSCGGDDPKTSAEEDQLKKLSSTWVLGTATLEGNPSPQIESDFSITFSGSFDSDNPEGPYNFVVTGTLTPSPLPPSGTWQFVAADADADEGQIQLIEDGMGITYEFLSSGELVLTFFCDDCDFPGARVSRTASVDGDWVFTLEED